MWTPDLESPQKSAHNDIKNVQIGWDPMCHRNMHF